MSYDIGDRIHKRRKELKLTQADIFENTGISSGNLTGIEKGRNLPSATAIISLSKILKCSTDWILLGKTLNLEYSDEEISLIESFKCLSETDKEKVLHFIEIANVSTSTSYIHKKDQITDHTVKEGSVYSAVGPIPVLGKVAAGTPILSYSSDFGTIVPENKAASYALIVQGDSMYPVILDKEYIEVTSQPDLEQGEIGIIMVDGDVTCKKFYNFKDHYELRSLNPDYATITVPKNPSTNLQILGKVSLTEAQMKRF